MKKVIAVIILVVVIICSGWVIVSCDTGSSAGTTVEIDTNHKPAKKATKKTYRKH